MLIYIVCKYKFYSLGYLISLKWMFYAFFELEKNDGERHAYIPPDEINVNYFDNPDPLATWFLVTD